MIAVVEGDAPLDSVDLGAGVCKTFGCAAEARADLRRPSPEFSIDVLPKAGDGDRPRYSAIDLPYTVKR